MHDDETLTTQQVAQRCGFHPGSLRNQRAAGRGLPWIRRMNGRIYYRLSDVIAWESTSAGMSQ